MKFYLAPMEGVGDRAFRKAMSKIGGFNEAVTDFIRVPTNAHVKSLAKVYQHDETTPIPLAAQLMGSDPVLMADMAVEIESRGAHRIDLNCGCPSNTVTGRGAGSSLLRDPSLLNEVATAMVKAVKVPVTIKLRSGFDDTSLFKENLLAAQDSGALFITLHPRTKAEGYGPPADWSLIAKAKNILKIPVIGNGDILTPLDAKRMIDETGCDGIMIGRGAVINPFIFHETRAFLNGTTFLPTWEKMEEFFSSYIADMPEEMTERGRINKLKQLFGFWYKRTPQLLEKRQAMLTFPIQGLESFIARGLSEVKAHFH